MVDECDDVKGSTIMRSSACKALLGLTFIATILASAVVNATASDGCKGKNYIPGLVPENMSVAEKKLRFRCLVEADLDAVFTELNTRYQQVLLAVNQDNDSEKLGRWRTKYEVDTNQDLLIAIKPHPRSIAIAQAAIESGWGTSRLFTEANNLFGIRPFDSSEARIITIEKRGEKSVWIRKYDSIRESIVDYYLVLGRASAYEEFRQLKMTTVDPHKLVSKLINYSERKLGYVKELSSMIRYNKFYELD